ncbi:hypothetical protein EV363DRAFT_1349995 [Boletus edulis]|nr:hypothetical protein EV363DRAFT_1349995 [Boletus edulis]
MYVRFLLPPFADNSHWYIVGGLDPHLSRHASTLLKSVSKNLPSLVDWECIFIGDGSKDFWIIDQFPACL